MKPQDRLVRWTDGEEEELDLAGGNPIPGNTEPNTGDLWDIFVTRAEGGPSAQLTFDYSNNKQPESFLARSYYVNVAW